MEGFLEFKDKLDEEIVMDAKAGNNKAQEYLISKYENFVKAKAKSYFLHISVYLVIHKYLKVCAFV